MQTHERLMSSTAPITMPPAVHHAQGPGSDGKPKGFTIEVVHTGAPPLPDMNAAQNRQPPESVLAERRKLMEAGVAAAGGSAALAAVIAPVVPVKPREDLESVEVKLPNGMLVEFGPPAGISMTLRIAQMFPEAAQNPGLDMIVRTCMSVRKINGNVTIAVTDNVSLASMANALGDVGMDMLGQCLVTYWSGVRLTDLAIVKKNLRQP